MAFVGAGLVPVFPLAGVVSGDSGIAAVLEAVRRLASTTPGVRVLVVPQDLRIGTTDSEPRLIAAASERRRVLVATEHRLFVVPAEVRGVAG